MDNNDVIKALFHNIGKPTLRGVRKCPKCGTSNGMRGFFCKNRECDVVFKETSEKKKQSADVCRVFTGTPTRIFSVRVRDKGPDYRGFVQLPIIPSTLNENFMSEPTPLCFVDSCQRTFNNNVLTCHERTLLSGDTNCQHIQATLRDYEEPVPLHISHTILFSLKFSMETKEEIWQLTLATIGPVVQKVSKTVMAVKCKVSPECPVGYLHVSFNQTQYTCDCTEFKDLMRSSMRGFGKCFHYYACIASFACNMKTCKEFSNFVDEERLVLDLTESGPSQSDGDGIEALDGDTNEPQLVTIIDDSVSDDEVEIEVLPDQEVILDPYPLGSSISQSSDFDSITESSISTEGMSELEMNGLEIICPDNESEVVNRMIVNPAFSHFRFIRPNDSQYGFKNKSRKRTASATVTSASEKRVKKKKTVKTRSNQETSSKKAHRASTSRPSTSRPSTSRASTSGASTSRSIGNLVVHDETLVKQSFLNWLSSVTERIYESMHFQFSGRPTSLVFHIPQEYFDCLRERISAGAFKKRLPNSTTAFVRKHSVPIGTFTKYTWHITNIIHCKQIFETPLMPLHITRSFVEKNGSFEPYVGPSAQDEAFSRMNNGRRIRPLELKTFLKVGRTSPFQNTPTPLIIEWIPNILPVSKVGELKITFEYGHRRPQ